MTIKELLDEANIFLKNNHEYNEVKLTAGQFTVHVIRQTPTIYAPTTWQPYFNPLTDDVMS